MDIGAVWLEEEKRVYFWCSVAVKSWSLREEERTTKIKNILSFPKDSANQWHVSETHTNKYRWKTCLNLKWKYFNYPTGSQRSSLWWKTGRQLILDNQLFSIGWYQNVIWREDEILYSSTYKTNYYKPSKGQWKSLQWF